jgi:hypothetical protein
VTPLRRSAIAAVLAAMACGAPAAVVDVSPTGFVVHHEAVVDASPADAYRALTNVGKWWNPAHSHSKNAVETGKPAEDRK